MFTTPPVCKILCDQSVPVCRGQLSSEQEIQTDLEFPLNFVTLPR